MNTLIFCALLGAQPVTPPAIKFDTLTLADAKPLAGGGSGVR